MSQKFGTFIGQGDIFLQWGTFIWDGRSFIWQEKHLFDGKGLLFWEGSQFCYKLLGGRNFDHVYEPLPTFIGFE